MNKVILNGCYGGYHWSNRGILDVIEKKGLLEHARFVDGYAEDKHEISVDEFANSKSYSGCHAFIGETWFDFERDDKDAIAVLEEKGSKYCSGSCSSLYVDEYDDDLFIYDIDEYDGCESLKLIPNLTESKVRQCRTIGDVIELLRKTGALVEPRNVLENVDLTSRGTELTEDDLTPLEYEEEVEFE